MNGDARAVWAEFSGLNASYMQDLYERYLADPASVDPQARELFERWGAPPSDPDGTGTSASPGVVAPTAPSVAAADGLDPIKVAGAMRLALAIRSYGHMAAQLDPLGGDPPGDRELQAEHHGISEQDLAALPASVVGEGAELARAVPAGAGNALEAIRALRRVYQGTSGYEYSHLSDEDERAWLYAAVESGQFRPPRDPIDERALLERLTEVGAFERFLQRAFPGQTRFSLEGLGMLVPLLDEVVGEAAEAGTRSVLLGMAHRGRLNVLVHVLGKPYEQSIAEFLGRYRRPNVSASGLSDEGWTGDVKYHLGARRAVRGGREVDMQVLLVPNPSHLEFVDPVVEGMARAADERRDGPGAPRQDELASLAVLIHGDGSFPGQGVVAETLNLSRLPGYRTGGTIHLIANNQLGFTTDPSDERSTLYASDLAKGFEIPVIHVNADDPEACIAAARLAHAYRQRFAKDVMLDLIGYRRWGHNEGDEPSFTQPRMYAAIAAHPTVRDLWAEELVRRGLVTKDEADGMLQAAIERLHAIRRALAEQPEEERAESTSGLEAGGETGGLGHAGAAADAQTAVPADVLARLNAHLYAVPEGFHLHSKLERPFARRRAAFVSPNGTEAERVDWAQAEALAFASIVADGTPIRLTGQDTARGTFSQRHLVLHDAEDGATYVPLQTLPEARASFEVWNSPLSEQAPLGFEFGYSVQAPDVLVVWEAQYGDFINSAQVIIDQFVTSARSKWGQEPALVLLLPHAYEGQGPEHSSARLERFLQQAAEDNLRIANCTTAAQYFHILRRQAQLLARDRRPLVLMTPKSLLRHPLATSAAEDLTQGSFQPVLDDPEARQHPRAVRRLVLCSGKVYMDLAAARQRALAPDAAQGIPAAGSAGVQSPLPQGEGQGKGVLSTQHVRGSAGVSPSSGSVPVSVAVARVEELYPFPANEIRDVVAAYPDLEEVVWLQEEPRNMGAWTYAAPRLRDLLGPYLPLRYVGRTRRASPAEGSHEWHTREQARLVADALGLQWPAIGEQRSAIGDQQAAAGGQRKVVS